MRQFKVTGMSCAACSARVEKAVSALDGITSCSVNLLTNLMNVEGIADDSEIIDAVNKAGYGIVKAGAKNNESGSDLNKKEEKSLKVCLISSLCFLIVLMYFSMGAMMWDFPLPAYLEHNHLAIGILQLILTSIILVINQRFFINGFKSLVRKSPNMDTLVALGASASFVYSVYALFAMSDAVMKGDFTASEAFMNEFYFESGAMIVTLITVGKMLESRSKGKTTDALKGLMKLAPKTAVLLKDDIETEVPVEEIKIDDIFVVRPGSSIPTDGIVIEGHSAVNESALTGESIPVDKTEGDSVSAATVNHSGYLKCRAVRVGEDTTLSQIIKLVSDASATKAPIAKIADKVSGIFVPLVIIIALITTLIWIFTGASFGFALARGISVLVISCPCALGLATPVAIMVGNGVGAKNGILFKTAVSLEQTGKAEIVVLDKTGTITKGQPEVTDIIPAEGTDTIYLLQVAASLEKRSEHPLAKAILKQADNNNIYIPDVSDFKALPGNGLSAKSDNADIYGGNYAFISSKTEISDEISKQIDLLSECGKTPLIFAENDKLLGIIAVSDVIKEDSKEAISELKKLGIRVIMLTGDNKRTAHTIGHAVSVDEVISDVLPDDKEKTIRDLKKQGHVIMVGDGINDAPALVSADVGIAIGAGTDIAIDAADVVLVKSSLKDVSAAIRLSRAALRNIHQNLFWAFFYNVIGIPLAAGIWIPVLGWQLNPMFGAAAMSLSSFCVVTNALRLNLIDVRKPVKDRKIKDKERKIMQKKLEIEGMMCPHCSGRVKQSLETLEGVIEAEVSHESGTAVVTLEKDIDDSILKDTVEKQGYKVL